MRRLLWSRPEPVTEVRRWPSPMKRSNAAPILVSRFL